MSFLIYNVWHSIKNKTHKEETVIQSSDPNPGMAKILELLELQNDYNKNVKGSNGKGEHV